MSAPLTDAGKAMLYGVLQGEETTVEGFSSARGSYMVREVGDHHTCVITDFRKGTIIFMPRDGLRDMAEPHDAGKLQCVTSNVARAMMMTPNVTTSLSATSWGERDMTKMAVYFVKPERAVAMTFTSDPQMGLVSTRFTGSAVTTLSTTAFPQLTASLR